MNEGAPSQATLPAGAAPSDPREGHGVSLFLLALVAVRARSRRRQYRRDGRGAAAERLIALEITRGQRSKPSKRHTSRS